MLYVQLLFIRAISNGMKIISALTWYALGLIVIGAGLRVVRHFGYLPLPPNVAPVSALAMFSAIGLPRRYAFVVPLGLMLVADMVIGFDLLPITLSIYACFAVSYLIGRWINRQFSVTRLVIGTLTGSIIFFLVTNAAVWAFSSIYVQTGTGLLQAYIAGLPFFRNTVLGDLGYTGLFFGLYQLAVVYSRRRAPVAVHD